jgi:uncharacterized protein YecE (DUF72 family)
MCSPTQSRLFAQPWHSFVRNCEHNLPPTTSTTRAPIDETRTVAEATAAEDVSERFRYHYQEQELQEWVPKVQHLAEGARNVHVLQNNCYSDYAVTNARQFMDLLGGADVSVAAPGV